MDAGVLRGKILGTCILQDVLGSGTMGAVYLAAQSQSPRQVAVKVLLRAASLDLLQQMEFLETFRKEITLVSSLEHPHIVSVSAYGDSDGLAYLVMPYIAGETLEELLAREGALPLPKAVSYLEQIAAALDYAHAQGVLHRDLKPANILVKTDGTLLLADFHLTAMLIEGKTAHMRLSRPGMLDYMSPEQVLGQSGKVVDGRSDLYSLGAILYRMVTGAPPFQGQTLMKVAMKHLKMPPSSPRTLRSDLPLEAAQTILTALAKNPAERYACAQDLALAFRHAALEHTAPTAPLQNATLDDTAPTAPIQNRISPFQDTPPAPTQHDTTGMHLYIPRGYLLSSPPTGSVQPYSLPDRGSPIIQPDGEAVAGSALAGWIQSSPVIQPDGEAVAGSALAGWIQTRTQFAWGAAGKLDKDPETQPRGQRGSNLFDPKWRTGALTAPDGQIFQHASSSTDAMPLKNKADVPGASLPTSSVTTAILTLSDLAQQGTESGGVTGTLKLTGPAKIVSIPVAGQPGQYRTGILPTLPSVQQPPPPAKRRSVGTRFIAPVCVLLALLVVIGSITFWLTHISPSHSPGPPKATTVGNSRTNLAATSTARAQATLEANTILYDPLTQNIRNWPVATSGTVLYQFKDGAYHITNNDPLRIAPAILQGETLDQPYAYSLNMQEIRGDDSSLNNEFGMILRFTSQQKNGSQLVSFYTLEVLNKVGGEYQFWQYNTSQATTSPWKELAHHPFGSEFHQGQGPKSLNTLKILVNGKNFTLIVNGKQVWTVQDGSLTNGSVGMLVNLKGTEVAFSDLRLTYM